MGLFAPTVDSATNVREYSDIGLRVIRKTIAYDDFTDGGSTTGTYVLSDSIPAGATVITSTVKDVTGFAGDSSATIQIGDGSDAGRYSTGTPSVFATASGIVAGVPSGVKEHATAVSTITVTVTSGSDFTSVSAGQCTVSIFYVL